MAVAWEGESIVDYTNKIDDGWEYLRDIFAGEGWKKSDRENYVDSEEDPCPFKDWYFEEVDSEGGGEGGAEDVHKVYSIKYPDGRVEYWAFNISYYSHYGYEWNGWERTFRKVEKKQVLVDDWVDV